MAPRTLAPRGRKRRGRRRSGVERPPNRRVSAATAPQIPTPAVTRAATAVLEPVRVPEVGSFEPELGTSLTEEERIGSAKYHPRHLPKRLFEEERFLFPESYGVDRVRLLVKDPEWLFAYWDLDQRSVDALRNEVGERALALTRLTLRIVDEGSGGMATILLPYGSRAWYVQADGAPRGYRAHLGWTLPSGEFRSLAESNVVVTPRNGPSPVGAARRARPDAAPAELAAAVAVPLEAPGPWIERPPEPGAPGEVPRPGRKKRQKGGASDVYRR